MRGGWISCVPTWYKGSGISSEVLYTVSRHLVLQHLINQIFFRLSVPMELVYCHQEYKLWVGNMCYWILLDIRSTGNRNWLDHSEILIIVSPNQSSWWRGVTLSCWNVKKLIWFNKLQKGCSPQTSPYFPSVEHTPLDRPKEHQKGFPGNSDSLYSTPTSPSLLLVAECFSSDMTRSTFYWRIVLSVSLMIICCKCFQFLTILADLA